MSTKSPGKPSSPCSSLLVSLWARSSPPSILSLSSRSLSSSECSSSLLSAGAGFLTALQWHRSELRFWVERGPYPTSSLMPILQCSGQGKIPSSSYLGMFKLLPIVIISNIMKNVFVLETFPVLFIISLRSIPRLRHVKIFKVLHNSYYLLKRLYLFLIPPDQQVKNFSIIIPFIRVIFLFTCLL